MTQKRKRVAIIGASGIGRHHAKWWHVEGADVCAFVGTSRESVAHTNDTLRDMFEFAGKGYTDVHDMLAAERPDLVDVCSPNALHTMHVRQALQADCDVLCEKPFVYDAAKSRQEMQEDAARLVKLAAERGRILGLCSQYYVGTQRCAELFSELRGATQVTRFDGHLASPAKGRPSDPINVWIDLGPHMLAAVQSLRAGGEIVPGSVSVECGPYMTGVACHVTASGQAPLECHIRVNRTQQAPNNIRTLTLDGMEFDIQGGQGKDGYYCSRLVTPEGELEAEDFMRLLIRQMLAGKPPMTGKAILTNQRWLLELAPDGQEGRMKAEGVVSKVLSKK